MSMKGPGPHTKVGSGGVADERAHGVGIDEAPLDIEVVDRLEAVGVALDEGVELGREDDGVAVAVGVVQAHPPVGGGEGALEQREHGGDAAAGAERDEVAVAAPSGPRQNTPAGTLASTTSPASSVSIIEFDTTPPGTRCTVTCSSSSTAGDDDIE